MLVWGVSPSLKLSMIYTVIFWIQPHTSRVSGCPASCRHAVFYVQTRRSRNVSCLCSPHIHSRYDCCGDAITPTLFYGVILQQHLKGILSIIWQIDNGSPHDRLQWRYLYSYGYLFVILDLVICGCWRYWIGVKLEIIEAIGVNSRTPRGILCGVLMDRDMATTKVASHLMWILDGIFDYGSYVGFRGLKWTKLSG